MNFLVKLTSQPFKNLRLGASVVNNFLQVQRRLVQFIRQPQSLHFL